MRKSDFRLIFRPQKFVHTAVHPVNVELKHILNSKVDWENVLTAVQKVARFRVTAECLCSPVESNDMNWAELSELFFPNEEVSNAAVPAQIKYFCYMASGVKQKNVQVVHFGENGGGPANTTADNSHLRQNFPDPCSADQWLSLLRKITKLLIAFCQLFMELAQYNLMTIIPRHYLQTAMFNLETSRVSRFRLFCSTTPILLCVRTLQQGFFQSSSQG